ncbi:MAG: Holliday junction branch migration protein RuvA [Prevotellaceae bacterium]|jgi:Holliday junction DNA helicase RuvA|nr:Holliday junction branch migration protein RuvA [Prevotellaceae bacterium]
MVDYIKGEIAEISPAHVVIEANNIGYFIHISLITYSELSSAKASKLYIYEAISEDAVKYFGFLTQSERALFMLLISVSGVGANTARVILSSLSPSELQSAVLSGNVAALKSVKGIGGKTAERIIVDLRDKMLKVEIDGKAGEITLDNSVKTEAVSALVMLGFSQMPAQKAVEKVFVQNPTAKVEQMIKMALKML